jgi:hypothetical protein
MNIGDRVRHPKFGTGIVLELNALTALVEWDTHRVNREFERRGRATPLKKHHSHVNQSLLTVLPPLLKE